MGDPVSTRPSAMISNVERSPTDPTGPRFRIEDIYPAVDGGRFAVKRIAGESFAVWADIFRDGHEEMRAALRWRRDGTKRWHAVEMKLHGNDRWSAPITLAEPGSYVFQIEAWTDAFATWRKGALLKKKAGLDISLELREGQELIASLKPKDSAVRAQIEKFAQGLPDEMLLSEDIADIISNSDARPDLSRSIPIPFVLERARARYSTWYEMVPRSQGRVVGQHGTFEDCIARVPDIAALGFDVLYLTPIHPIGKTNRKGKNNTLKAGPDDPGSFYAVGDETGGHDAIHPDLGSLSDFRRLVETCKAYGLEIALDIAVQCSPDHPWLKRHPEWFKW
ncbi:MAG: DUF3416 domain-containing protein, partial [Pseudolabrys sp.]|nr:DUF3416 domain-containing protein [Pseudolabrys sp.]